MNFLRELTDENIFKSMYILNKSAKKSRDTQKKARRDTGSTCRAEVVDTERQHFCHSKVFTAKDLNYYRNLTLTPLK